MRDEHKAGQDKGQDTATRQLGGYSCTRGSVMRMGAEAAAGK